jgi:hypothetical protein
VGVVGYLEWQMRPAGIVCTVPLNSTLFVVVVFCRE